MNDGRANMTTEAAKPPAIVNETRIRVRYAETDQMGVVYHANHFIWFEVGRVELLRQLGFSYRDMEQQDHCFIAVVLASANVVGGFVVTDRMLEMFKKRDKPEK